MNPIELKRKFIDELRKYAYVKISAINDDGGKLQIETSKDFMADEGRYVRIFGLDFNSPIYNMIKVIDTTIVGDAKKLTLDCDYSNYDIINKYVGLFKIFNTIMNPIYEKDCPFVVVEKPVPLAYFAEVITYRQSEFPVLSGTSISETGEISQEDEDVIEEIVFKNLVDVLLISKTTDDEIIFDSILSVLGNMPYTGYIAKVTL